MHVRFHGQTQGESAIGQKRQRRRCILERDFGQGILAFLQSNKSFHPTQQT
jgi:hypothetical protein